MSDLNKNEPWLRRKVLNLLGAVDGASHTDEVNRVSSEIMHRCMKFAEENLTSRSGLSLATGRSLTNSLVSGDVVIIGDRVRVVCNEIEGNILVAPWCKQFYANSNYIKGKKGENQ